ncbi:MAG: gamma-glutamyl-gamma-aminobutyrate hydrolase family protein [Clostridiales bacterium]|nr:gamma-glutamyl-gamma-aminobutyrate hydrolase family protein [Clostridiales bacterium]
MLPVIGIVPMFDDKRENYRIRPEYMDAVSCAGGIPVMLHPSEDEAVLNQLIESCDGFIFSGGQDIEPAFYGEEKLDFCEECMAERDSYEIKFLKLVLDCNKPVLGICRGIQVFNVLLGGSLYQDVPSQLGAAVKHRAGVVGETAMHRVAVCENTPLSRLTGDSVINVNSFHHQAIKMPAPGLKIMAKAEDGVIEAVYLPEKSFAMAVQWHPERMYKSDKDALALFEALVEAAKE